MTQLAFTTADDAGRNTLGPLLAHAFGFPEEDAKGWFEKSGHDNIRTLLRGDRIVAGLIQIPMGQFFGGVSIPAVGIAGVGVSPEERGAGVGTALMLASLREARENGVPLSVLYPATITLYRGAGYEVAGGRYRIEMDPRLLEIKRPEGVTFSEYPGLERAEDIPKELRAIYADFARYYAGYLDRGPYVWTRTVSLRGHHGTKTFGVKVDGRLEGYVSLSHKMEPSRGTTVTLTDLAATSSRGARAILWFCAQYRSVATKLTWFGGPSDIFTAQLPERRHSCSLDNYFMLRIVDPAKALTMRRYPQSLTTELVIDLDDRTMPENRGIFTVSIASGEATVTEGAKPTTPRLRLDERALASLYAGHIPVMTAAQAGFLEGGADALDRASLLFSGPAPAMSDFF